MDTPPPLLKIQAPIRVTRQVPVTPTRRSPITTLPPPPGGGLKPKSDSSRQSNSSNSNSPIHTPHHPHPPHFSPDIIQGGSGHSKGRAHHANPYSSDSEMEEEDEDDTFGDDSSRSTFTPISIPFEWTSKSMSTFYRVLLKNGFRPVGINKHFKMMTAHQDFCKAVNRNVDVQHLWDHLDTLYDMEKLEKLEDEAEFKVKDFDITDYVDLKEFARARFEVENERNPIKIKIEESDEEDEDVSEAELPILTPESLKVSHLSKKPRLQ